jgi:hypothetical protein
VTARLPLLLALAAACGDASGQRKAERVSCSELGQDFGDYVEAVWSSLDDGCPAADDGTGVRALAVRGVVPCIASESCLYPVAKTSARAMREFLDEDPVLGEKCLTLRRLGCPLRVADCGPVAPVCESGRCGLVAVEPP